MAQMTISELVEALNEMKEVYGNLEVKLQARERGDSEIYGLAATIDVFPQSEDRYVYIVQGKVESRYNPSYAEVALPPGLVPAR